MSSKSPAPAYPQIRNPTRNYAIKLVCGGMRGSGAALCPVPRKALFFPLPVALLIQPALVVLLAPFAQADAQLGFRSAPVQDERNQGQPALLDLSGQPIDLVAMQEEFAVAVGYRGRVGAGARQRGEAGAGQPGFMVADGHEGLRKAGAVGAQGLHLPSQQREPGVEFLEDLKIAVSSAIRRDPSRLWFARHVFRCVVLRRNGRLGQGSRITRQRADRAVLRAVAPA